MAASDLEELNIGADVIGSEGNKLGTVSYVVVRPPELSVTDVVVSTGAILGRDIVVPIDKVDRVGDNTVHLTIGKDELRGYKDYVDIHYDTPPETWAAPTDFMYPTAGVLWPAGMYYPQESSVTVNAPQGTVGVRSGMEVESSDGHKVGTVHKLDIDSAREDVVGVVVKQGFIFTHDVTIPVECISDVREGVIRLNLTKDEAKNRFGRKEGS